MLKTNFLMKPLTFEEAVNYFREKVPMTDSEYYKLSETARSKAFTVAKVTRLDILQDVFDEIKKALETGTTLKEFQKSIKARMQDKGWQGLAPYRLDTIFRTNIQTAYMAGRYRQMRSPAVVEARPYWLYVTVNDGGTRPSHKVMDGLCRRYDDPIWETWYPPNGFRCRCKVIPLSAEAAKRRGVAIGQNDVPQAVNPETGEIHSLSPDRGFEYNAARGDWQPDLSRYDPEVRNLYHE